MSLSGTVRTGILSEIVSGPAGEASFLLLSSEKQVARDPVMEEGELDGMMDGRWRAGGCKDGYNRCWMDGVHMEGRGRRASR